MSSRLARVVVYYACTMALLLSGLLFYDSVEIFRMYFGDPIMFGTTSFSGYELMYYYVMFMTIVLPFYYLTLPENSIPKSYRVVSLAFRMRGFTLEREDKVALLAVLVKLLFIPYMFVWTVGHASSLLINASNYIEQGVFFPDGYWMLFYLLLMIDVFCFCLGYSIEHPRLNNEIKSVEPTVLGWVVTMMCYPPFNQLTTSVIGSYTAEMPLVESLWAKYILGVGILSMMSIYVWGSATLFLRASNLTSRGVVTRGPFRWVRHPQYTAKNLSWWIAGIPFFMEAANDGYLQMAYVLVSLSAWTGIYYLRAITEERHLSHDADYLVYKKNVVHRFIPGVW